MNIIDNKSNLYYIFNLETKAYFNHQFTLTSLLNYLAENQIDEQISRSKYNNKILDNLNMNVKDKKYELFNSDKLRQYIIVDGYHRIIDVRRYAKEIKARYIYINQISRNKRYCLNSMYIGRMKRRVGQGYEGVIFRKEPIPYITNHSSNPYRSVKTTNELRQNSDKELKGYVRANRNKKHLPNSYDDIHRGYIKCWKSQSKKSKQWM